LEKFSLGDDPYKRSGLSYVSRPILAPNRDLLTVLIWSTAISVFRKGCFLTGHPKFFVRRCDRGIFPVFTVRLFHERDPQVLADFSDQLIEDLVMARHGGPKILLRISPPLMTAAFTNEDTAMLAQVFEKKGPLHKIRIFSSSSMSQVFQDEKR